MKKLFYLFIVLMLASCGSENTANISSNNSQNISSMKISVQSILSQMEKGNYKEGELLVKFKSGVTSSSSLKINQAIGSSVTRKFTIVPNLEHIILPKGLSVKDAITKYMADPNVEYAEPNYIIHAYTNIPNDTYFGQQWALRNIGQFAAGTPGADIKAADAWDISTVAGATIAILDTGIDYNHQDLVGNIWRNTGETDCTNGIDDDGNGYIDDCKGWDFVNNDNDPMDDSGHGTHVAGIAGAVGNNNTGISGVLWTARLMPVKILDESGHGTIDNEILGIDYAVRNGAKIINASYGGSEYSLSEYFAITDANYAGVLLIAAAGNGGDDAIGDNNDLTPEYPASYNLPNIISVAATDQNDVRAPFSNFGMKTVHVAAPGVYILSTIPQNLFSDKDFDSGTSMAAPHVSGLAGLLYSYYDYFNYSQIRGTILRYVDYLSSLDGWIQRSGRINAYKAISSLLKPSGLTAAADSMSQISLAWSDNATGEDGYKVERKTSGGTYAQITTLVADSKSYTNDSLIDGTLYIYRIRAYNVLPNPGTGSTSDIGADSAYSDEASVATLLSPPTALTASAISSSQVSLAWIDNSQTEEGYKIERKSDGNFVQVATVGPNITAYDDSGLIPSTSYTYRVRAYNTDAGNSNYSNEATVTTLTTTGGASSHHGGGGCSVGDRQNAPTAIADLLLLTAPILFIAILRRRKN
jgi:subtilisin family serine protease